MLVLFLAPVKCLNSQCCHMLATILLTEGSEPIRPAHGATSHLHTAIWPHQSFHSHIQLFPLGRSFYKVSLITS